MPRGRNVRVGVRVERVGAKLRADGANLIRRKGAADSRAHQIRPAVFGNNTATHRTLRLRRDRRGALPPRGVFFSPILGRTDARSTCERFVSAEAPVTVNTQMHIQGQVVVESHEQVLPRARMHR